jgi:dsDNA-specific endonuclease/ATPase MutS2
MDKEDDNLFEEPVKLPLEDWIDLHTFSPRDIPDLLESYLDECHEAGFKEVRIIHGKGIGVQRKIVQKFLQESPLIERFKQASPEAGGWGATIAILKERQ